MTLQEAFENASLGLPQDWSEDPEVTKLFFPVSVGRTTIGALAHQQEPTTLFVPYRATVYKTFEPVLVDGVVVGYMDPREAVSELIVHWQHTPYVEGREVTSEQTEQSDGQSNGQPEAVPASAPAEDEAG